MRATKQNDLKYTYGQVLVTRAENGFTMCGVLTDKSNSDLFIADTPEFAAHLLRDLLKEPHDYKEIPYSEDGQTSGGPSSSPTCPGV